MYKMAQKNSPEPKAKGDVSEEAEEETFENQEEGGQASRASRAC